MEAAYQMRRAEQSFFSALYQGLARIRMEVKGQKIRTLVVSVREKKCVQVNKSRCIVEIRDGFNENLIVQYYGGKKVVIYIPAKWEEEIEVKINKGMIYCLQKNQHKKLKLTVRNGKIFA